MIDPTPPAFLLAEVGGIRLPPHRLLQQMPRDAHCFLLDSGGDNRALATHSYLGVYPFMMLVADVDQPVKRVWLDGSGAGEVEELSGGAFSAVRDSLRMLRPSTGGSWGPGSGARPASGELPALLRSGGAVGFFSYDLRLELERLSAPAAADIDFPLMVFGFYDAVAAYDVAQRRYRVGAIENSHSSLGARERAERLTDILRTAAAAASRDSAPPDGNGSRVNLASTTTRAQYIAAVERAKEHIRAGDIFQANLSQRFTAEPAGDPRALYEAVRTATPAPFGAYLEYEDFQIASASPELFLRVRGRQVETRPIKGTRPRGAAAAEDAALASQLTRSAKERAENVMIVDVERNDLGRVCEPGTVRVPELLRVESHPTVHHLVSSVTGRFRDGVDAIDVVQAAFPGGSITGAPKIRAMEIIDELEGQARGPYTGSIGYFAFDGDADLNIVIRSLLIQGGRAYLHVGGGIVADSDPAAEYEETLTKAKALLSALRSVSGRSRAMAR